MIVWRSPDGLMELRLGDWREVLADVEACDAVIADPPYGARVHKGQRHGRADRIGANGYAKCDGRVSTTGLGYDAFSPEDVEVFIRRWGAASSGWLCGFTSSDLVSDYENAAKQAGRYAFAPLAVVTPGMNVRLAGDGPSNWTVYLMVSRPRSGPITKWGTLPGAYIAKHHKYDDGVGVPGAKSVGLMRAIVRDYSRSGNLIVDPCAGGGTTILAAAMEGRRAIGSEIDPETFEKAVARLSKGYTSDMFA